MPTRVELVTPERVLYAGDAGFVVLRTDDGEIMFLPEHAPFVGAVDICVVRIDAAGGEESGPGGAAGSSGAGAGGSGTGGGAGAGGASAGGTGAGGSGTGGAAAGAAGEVRAAVAGGFVHVADNQVTVLAGVAELADEIDVERARRAFDAAAADVASGMAAGGRASRDEEERHRAAPARPQGDAAADAGDEPAREEIAETPTMRALVSPDEPDVRARRAANRLEAAGEADQNIAAVASGSAPAA